MLLTGLSAALCPALLHAQYASGLLVEGDLLPGEGRPAGISSIAPAAVNDHGDFILRVITVDPFDLIPSRSYIWGSLDASPPTVLESSASLDGPGISNLSFTHRVGLANDGSYAYVVDFRDTAISTVTNIRALRSNLGEILRETDPADAVAPPPPQYTWRTTIAQPYMDRYTGEIAFVGGYTQPTPNLVSVGAGAFRTGPLGTICLLKSGDPLPGTSGVVGSESAYRVSNLSCAPDLSHWLCIAYMTPSTATPPSLGNADRTLVRSGQAATTASGAVIREGQPIPVVDGGSPGTVLRGFDLFSINSSGSWILRGYDGPNSETDDFIMKDGVVIARQGQPYHWTPSLGTTGSMAINDDGDWLFVMGNTLFFNGRQLLRPGDVLDLFDAGYPAELFTLLNLTISNAGSAAVITPRDAQGRPTIYILGRATELSPANRSILLRIDPYRVRADFDDDLRGTSQDLAMFLARYDQSAGPASLFDLNRDGFIWEEDLYAVLRDFGQDRTPAPTP